MIRSVEPIPNFVLCSCGISAWTLPRPSCHNKDSCWFRCWPYTLYGRFGDINPDANPRAHPHHACGCTVLVELRAGHTKMEAFWCEMYSPSGCSIAIESGSLTIICLDCFFSLHARGGRLREPCAIGGKAFCKACLN